MHEDTGRRCEERFSLAPMYTAVTARRLDEGLSTQSGELRGHVYDISTSGLRIELDEALQPGESVALELDLPGTFTTLAASASVVRVNDDEDDPGPRRIALRFTGFADRTHRDRLFCYLQNVVRKAA